MLPTWKNRPEVTANLLNPAFCSEIMRECMIAFEEESSDNLPFSLSLLILPFILNGRFRRTLPKTKVTPLHTWINNNEQLKIDLAVQIRSFMPFTREALMFGIAHKSLSITEKGHIAVLPRRKRIKSDDEEIKNCISRAGVLGKLLHRSGSPLTIYSIIGVKP
jgi:hypothetical protein